MKTEHLLFEDRKPRSGFKFPTEYARLLESGFPEIEPWFWLAPYPKSSKFWDETLMKQFPARKLIPFAKDGGSDNLACFDEECQDEKCVRIIHSYCDPGYEVRSELMSFEEWLSSQLELTKQFLEEDE